MVRPPLSLEGHKESRRQLSHDPRRSAVPLHCGSPGLGHPGPSQFAGPQASADSGCGFDITLPARYARNTAPRRHTGHRAQLVRSSSFPLLRPTPALEPHGKTLLCQTSKRKDMAGKSGPTTPRHPVLRGLGLEEAGGPREPEALTSEVHKQRSKAGGGEVPLGSDVGVDRVQRRQRVEAHHRLRGHILQKGKQTHGEARLCLQQTSS